MIDDSILVHMMNDFAIRVGMAFENELIGGAIVLTFVTPTATCQYMHGTMPQMAVELMNHIAEVVSDIDWPDGN